MPSKRRNPRFKSTPMAPIMVLIAITEALGKQRLRCERLGRLALAVGSPQGQRSALHTLLSFGARWPGGRHRTCSVSPTSLTRVARLFPSAPKEKRRGSTPGLLLPRSLLLLGFLWQVAGGGLGKGAAVAAGGRVPWTSSS